MKTAVLGTGSWGTALGQVLCDNGNEVVMWGVEEAQVKDINENHRNSAYYEDPLHEALRADTDMQCIKDADILLAAV